MLITFANPGCLDPLAITTFGLNAKDSASAIGEFGTGLKIAIAVILRLGGNLTIRTYGDGRAARYSFHTERKTVRSKEFDFVYMDVREHSYDHIKDTFALGFTTELGKHWQPWMAYRELRSNMVDEGGEIDGTFPAPYTIIVVDCPAIAEAHAEAGSFFLETKPIWANDELEIHPAQHNNAVFYRGINVAEAEERTLFTYNILTKQALTEDRTLDLWNCSWAIVRALAKLDDQPLAEQILLARPQTWENTFSFAYIDDFSAAMKNAIRLHEYNEHMNSTAKSRARSLFAGDYVPRAIPMTHEQLSIVGDVNIALAMFDIETPWTAIRLGDQHMDEEDCILANGILFIKPSVLEDENFFYRILNAHFQNTPWHQWKREAFIVRLMQRFDQNLTFWSRLTPPEPAEPTRETTSISAPLDAIAGSEDTF